MKRREYIGLRGIVNFYASLNGFSCTGADGIAGISSPATSMKQLSRKQVSGLLIPISLTLLTFIYLFWNVCVFNKKIFGVC